MECGSDHDFSAVFVSFRFLEIKCYHLRHHFIKCHFGFPAKFRNLLRWVGPIYPTDYSTFIAVSTLFTKIEISGLFSSIRDLSFDGGFIRSARTIIINHVFSGNFISDIARVVKKRGLSPITTMRGLRFTVCD
jgi:hypothetical protein